MSQVAEIGVFGGSGFYSLLENVREVKVDTPYGPPSDNVFLAEVSGRKVAFLPRHGRMHTIPPHMLNYRANVWAMRSLGVQAIISPCAAGSLQKHVKPGDFVVSDQFVDRTNGRKDTFFDGPIVTHVSPADTYDPELRQIAIDACRKNNISVHETGTVVVIQGPRFSTKAESKWFSDAGWEVINMTQYPEAYLCRELGMAVVPFTWPVGMGKVFGGVLDLRKQQMRVVSPGEDRKADDDEIIEGLANPVYAERFGAAYEHARNDMELVQEAAPAFDEEQFLAGHQTPMFFG